jgi:hypothetical protein
MPYPVRIPDLSEKGYIFLSFFNAGYFTLTLKLREKSQGIAKK